LPLPAYESTGAAGMDLRAAVPDDRPLLILPGKRALVPTGLILEIPEGMEGQVRPRSGLAFKHGLTVLNTPGTIDSDYRGEVKVLLINLGDEDFAVTRGMRVAQIIFAAVAQATVEERSLAGGTARGAGGFGSTGTA
ncbi:dUTP diphosphatase, partial [Mesorhizobium sp.]